MNTIDLLANGHDNSNTNGIAVKLENADETLEHTANGFPNGDSQIEGLYDDEEESPSKRMRTLSVAAEDEADADGEVVAVEDDEDEEFLEQLV